MHDVALEVIDARKVWYAGVVQLADGADKEVAGNGVGARILCFFAAGDSDVDLPLLGLLVPRGGVYAVVEPDVFVQVPLLCDRDEIILTTFSQLQSRL